MALSYLDSQKRSHPELLADISELEGLYTRKLWHQLTEALLRVAGAGRFDLVSLYEHFVHEFEQRVNPLSLVKFCAAVAARQGAPEARAFFEVQEPKVRGSRDAHVLALATLGLLRLRDTSTARAAALSGAKAAMEAAGAELGIAGEDGGSAACVVDAAALAQYHRLATEYHRERGDAEEFYRAGVAYLGFVALSDMPPQEQLSLASSLAVAAVAARSVYNFGELLGHPVCRTLEADAGGAWLVSLLRAMNRGDPAALAAALAADGGARLAAHAALRGCETLMREKVSILALMELVFQRPPHQHSEAQALSFAAIAQATGVRECEVELLVMRALALGLVRGTIDEVAQCVTITWVQPRVLERSQLEGMALRMGAWADAIASVQTALERFTDEVSV